MSSGKKSPPHKYRDRSRWKPYRDRTAIPPPFLDSPFRSSSVYLTSKVACSGMDSRPGSLTSSDNGSLSYLACSPARSSSQGGSSVQSTASLPTPSDSNFAVPSAYYLPLTGETAAAAADPAPPSPPAPAPGGRKTSEAAFDPLEHRVAHRGALAVQTAGREHSYERAAGSHSPGPGVPGRSLAGGAPARSPSRNLSRPCPRPKRRVVSSSGYP